MNDTLVYSRQQWIRAVNASALLGWLAVAGPIVFQPGALIYAAIIGLPVAFLTCWVIAAPVLRRVMRQSISWSRAAAWGAVISLIIASVGIAIGRYRGWQASQDPNFWFQIGGGDYIQEIDGILTLYGWWRLANSTVVFVLAGIVIALIVRALIGPGREAKHLGAGTSNFPLP